jgi:hypothetical protein
MKTSLTLLAALIATSATIASAAPNVPTAASSSSPNQYWTDSERMVYGPKVNPGKLKQPGAQVGASANAGGAAMSDEYCGNGIKPIPGVNPVRNGAVRGGSGLAMNDIEPCGTRVPGRIPGGVGPVGPR